MSIAVAQDPRLKLATATRPDQPFTWADLQQLPSDGFRYELIDGVLVMSPSPSFLHQRVVTQLLKALLPAVPDGYEVMTAPLDWVVSETDVFEPDVLIAETPADPLARLERTPLLAVEVLSPSSKLWDLHTKRAAYEAAGLRDYWVFDPAKPSLTVFRLRAGRLEAEAEIVGDQTYDAVSPVVARVTPSALIKP